MTLNRKENFKLALDLYEQKTGVRVDPNGLMAALAFAVFDGPEVPNTPEQAVVFINDIVWAGTPPAGPFE